MGVWHTSPDNRAHALRQVDAVSGRDCPYARYRLKYPPPTSATRMAIMSQIQRGLRFQQLHTAEAIFLMPNAWDVGSALMLASCGFPAIATTSAGVAFSLGFPDQEAAVSRETMLDRVGSIAAASPLPVSADLQSGYGASPEEVGEKPSRLRFVLVWWARTSRTTAAILRKPCSTESTLSRAFGQQDAPRTRREFLLF